jgi:hypothetical protein
MRRLCPTADPRFDEVVNGVDDRIQDLMEKDSGQYGCKSSPLHDACVRMVQHSCFHDPGTEPCPDEAQYPSIIDPLAEHFPQSSPINTVEVSTDICIHDPAYAFRRAPLA